MRDDAWMRFGLQMESTGLAGDPRLFAAISREAEDAGWDGMFISDPGYPTMGTGAALDIADPWICLAAMAEATERMRIGTLITPLPRYHPYEVAVRTTTLDRLSDGRLDLTVGVGHRGAFDLLGIDAASRPDRLRAALDVLGRLWSGKESDGLKLSPGPIQSPRIRTRICAWNPTTSIDLAAQWDGVHVPHYHPDKTCEERGCFDRVREVRRRVGDGDVALEGFVGRPETSPDICRAFADVGVTWWLESVWWYQSHDLDHDKLRDRIRKGPPR